ncbi:MAG: ribose-phosphate pyrophosphokinase [Cytophagales bacterium]|nr:ribose-phosphate pyrophosphokinase [Cytophagales bacterium]
MYFILNEDLKKSYEVNPELLVEFDAHTFSGGEEHIRITNVDFINQVSPDDIVFVTKLRTAKDLVQLQMAVDALDNIGTGANFVLEIAYMPGARQDRPCNKGESTFVKSYASIINNMTNWGQINILDAHSDVAPAVLDNCQNTANTSLVDKAIVELDLEGITLVSPDAGANKKVLTLAKHINSTQYPHDKNNLAKCDVVRADKNRDLATGEILETIVYADSLEGKDCLIVDDICDGGRTFIELAKVLKEKGARNVILFVTHGIFSKGYDVVLEHVDQIVTTNSFADLDADNGGSITVLPITQVTL